MKKEMFLFILLILNISFTKQAIEKKTLIERNDSLFTIKSSPYSGIAVTYFDVTGELESKIEYVNGVKNGRAFLYYKNGNIREEGLYKYGLRNGVFKKYFTNGSLGLFKNYDMGVEHGPEIHFLKSGGKWQELDFEHGKVDGRWFY